MLKNKKLSAIILNRGAFMNKIKFLLIIVLTITVCNSCKLAGWPKYSLTGASISPDVKTFSVDYFPNKAPLVVPYLSSLFTDKLTEYMRTKTGLSRSSSPFLALKTEAT